MKKNLLVLFVFLAGLIISYGQSVQVNAPYVAGNAGFDWGFGEIQTGATFQFDGTYTPTDGVDSVQLKVLQLDGSTWGAKFEYILNSDGMDGKPIDGIIDEQLTVPSNFPVSADNPNDFFLLQARVWFDGLAFPDADAYSNGWGPTMIQGYTRGQNVTMEGGQSVVQYGKVQVPVNGTVTPVGSYGVVDATEATYSIGRFNQDWTFDSLIYDTTIYDNTTPIGTNTGKVRGFQASLEGLAKTADIGTDFYFIQSILKYTSGDTTLNTTLVVVDTVKPVSLSVTDTMILCYNKANDSALISVNIAPTNVSSDTVYFTSLDPSVATVDERGMVVSQVSADDTVKIEVVTQLDEFEGSDPLRDTVVVIMNYVPVTAINLAYTDSSVVLTTDEITISLGATLVPENASYQGFNWASSDESVATVSGGNITCVGEGTTTITVTDTDDLTAVSSTCDITVDDQRITGISVTPSTVSVAFGETQQLTATITPADAYTDSVIWSSSNSDLVAVDANGLITPQAIPPTSDPILIIAAAAGNTDIKDTCEVTIPVGVSETQLTNVELYPNPASTAVTLKGLEGQYNVTIYNLAGVQFMNITVDIKGETTIDVSELPTGAYIMQVFNSDARITKQLNIN